jgi:hypothetical protein
MPLIAQALESLGDPSSHGYRMYNLMNRGQSTWADDGQLHDTRRSYLQYNTMKTFEAAGFRKGALTAWQAVRPQCGRYGYIIVNYSQGWVNQLHHSGYRKY